MKVDLSFFKKNKDSFFIAGFLFAMLLLKLPAPDEMSSFSTTPYFVSNKLGIVSRSFIGNIIFTFTDFLSEKTLYTVILIFTCLMICMLSFLAGYVIKKLDGDLQQTARFTALLYLLLPTSVIFLFKDINFGRFDLYQIILSMILSVVASKKGFHYLCPVIMAVGIMIHQVNIFYMPFCVIALLLEIKKSGFKKSRIITTVISVVAVVSLFFYYQFYPKTLNFATAEEAAAFLQQFTDIEISSSVLFGEYYSNVFELWRSYVWPILRGDSIPDLLFVFPFLIPVFVLFFVLWKGAFKKAEDSFSKFIFFLALISPLASLPQFILINDYGRWFAALFINQFFTLFYMLYRKENAVSESLLSIRDFFKKHTVALVMLIIWMACVLASASYNM
ncbi:MAG: hypothetical protein IJB86_01935 [Clostridia bacterium]|nr:hypothetical protein [Clostridia bacterium]